MSAFSSSLSNAPGEADPPPPMSAVNLDDRPASTRAPSSLGAEGEAGEGSAHSSAVSVFHSSLAESRTFTR